MTTLQSKIDAFKCTIHLTKMQWLKAILLTPVLIPLRVLNTLLALLINEVISYVVLYGVSEEERVGRAFKGWRHILKQVLRYVSKMMMTLNGVWLRIEGEESSEEVAIHVVAPHTSFLDFLVCFAFSQTPYFISRKENADVPLFGRCILATQCLLVDRSEADSKRKTLLELKRRAGKTENKWPKTIIFPEGTTTNGKALISFKVGAFVSGMPVQPTLLRYPNNPIDTVTWTWNQNMGYLMLIWINMTTLWTNTVIQYLPVYYPTQEEKDEPKLYAENVRKVMASALGIPMSEQNATSYCNRFDESGNFD